MEIEQKKMRTFCGGQMKLFFIGGRTVTGREFFTIHVQISFR